jgi:hypothetical protein
MAGAVRPSGTRCPYGIIAVLCLLSWGVATAAHAVLSARGVGMVVEGTPSLLLLKAGGVVAGSWVGMLREPEQKEVIREAMQVAGSGAQSDGRND